MRKFALATTALVAAATLAAPARAIDGIELELKGYAQFGFAGIVNGPDDTVLFGPLLDGTDPIPGGPVEVTGNSVVFGSDSEVHFRGTTTLDSGLAISFRAELELEDDSRVDAEADIIDEVYGQIDSGFGRLQIGMQDGAADQMIISAPNVFSQFTISSLDMNPFNLYTSTDLRSGLRDIIGLSGEFAYLDTSPDFTDDFTKVIYFTPRIYGVQLGASYAPNPCRNDSGLEIDDSAGSTDPEIDPDRLFSCGNDDVFGSNFWEVAGNFEQDFNGFGIGVSASYGEGDGNRLVSELIPASGGDGDEEQGPSEWHLGGEMFFKLGGGKLTIGGAYKETDATDAGNTSIVNLVLADNDVDATRSQHWDLGATYTFGPWELGGAYGRARSTYEYFLDGEADSELSTVIGGVSRIIGPGMRLGLGLIHSDAEASLTPLGSGVTAPGKIDTTAVFTELDLRF